MTTLNTSRCSAPLHTRSRFSPLSILNRIHNTWRQRQILGNLSPEALDDIGVTRKDATTEARRPIWDVPATWRD